MACGFPSLAGADHRRRRRLQRLRAGVRRRQHLAAGDPVPEVEARNQDGAPVTLSRYRGHPLVVYFYPKDRTSGCTIEAHAFRSDYPKFKELGVEILGVSNDDVASHQNFCDAGGAAVPAAGRSRSGRRARLRREVDAGLLPAHHVRHRCRWGRAPGVRSGAPGRARARGAGRCEGLGRRIVRAATVGRSNASIDLLLPSLVLPLKLRCAVRDEAGDEDRRAHHQVVHHGK